jgi:hypothetical protein
MFVFTHKQAGAGSGTSCVQHSLHPVHVEAVVGWWDLRFENFSKQIK